jgi:predicted dehydrogenase
MVGLGMGIIGCGRMGKVWVDAIGRSEAASVRAVFDTNQEAAAEKAALAGDGAVALSGQIDDLLQRSDVDAIVVCTPTFTHVDTVDQIAAAGKHILCEKPMALTLGQARRMINACSQADVKLAIGHTLRFWGAFLTTRRLVEEGVIGTPAFAQVIRGGAAGRRAIETDGAEADGGRPWRIDTRYSGGNILEGVVHELDFTRTLLGELCYASATASGRIEGAGHVSPIVLQAVLEFAGGGSATCRMGNWVGYDGGGTWVAGTTGTLRFTDWTGPVWLHEPGEDPRPIEAADSLAYDRELADFLGAVDSGGEPENSGLNGLQNLGLGLALYQSIAEGRRIQFTDQMPVGVDDDYQYRGPNTVI